MDLVDPHITAPRVRAALAYSGIYVKDSLERVGIPKATMQRIVSPTKPRRVSIEEMQLIAKACPDVPDWFLEHGFAPPVETGEVDLRERQRELEARLDASIAELRGLVTPRAPVAPGEGDELPSPGGELDRDFRADQPNPRDLPRTDSQPEADANPGSGG